jgi:peptidoglycan L-alanyl-D-glutamate endopeptidase CwlK
MTYRFSKASLASREKLHPKLQLLVDLAIKEIDFKILDATRGRAAQTKAFLQGTSKAKFGQSAHNYVPAIAVDLFPAPYKWEGKAAMEAFDNLGRIMFRLAKENNIPLRWGGDWNMDGSKTTNDAWDKPHFELHPWRDWSKKSKLVQD